jgi:hypothetical protein
MRSRDGKRPPGYDGAGAGGRCGDSAVTVVTCVGSLVGVRNDSAGAPCAKLAGMPAKARGTATANRYICVEILRCKALSPAFQRQ